MGNRTTDYALRYGSTLLLLLLHLAFLPSVRATDEFSLEKGSHPAPHFETCDRDASTPRWYVFVSALNAYPKLESEELVDRLYNKPMRLLAPGFDDVRTIGSTRDDVQLWSPNFGVGCVLSSKWCVHAQFGFAAGKVRTKADDVSVLLLPLHTDFEIQRGAYYVGLGAEYYPLGVVVLESRRGLRARVRGAKPFVGVRAMCSYATYKAKAKVGFKPFDNLIDYEQSGAWWVPNTTVIAGVDAPLTERQTVSLEANYAFFHEQGRNFNGPSLSATWKWHLK